MSTALVPRETIGEAVERVLVGGDLAKLTADERVNYYKSVCDSVGLNPLTRPLEYIQLNGKLTLYARKDATDQLRANNQVSINIVSREAIEGCYVVTARATMPSGRCDESIGAVTIEGLKGEARSNALMKCETKAKRRATLSICGMGMLDESEIESIPGAKVGEITPKVTAAPIIIGKPQDTAAGTGAVVAVGGPALSSGLVGTDPKAAPQVSSQPLVLSDLPESEFPTLEQQQKFAMAYRDALPDKFKPHADQLRKVALAEDGWVKNGEGSSKVIFKKEFQRVANKLIREAKEMKDPFIANTDDLPSNI